MVSLALMVIVMSAFRWLGVMKKYARRLAANLKNSCIQAMR